MLHFGGNGHAAVRLEGVRQALAQFESAPVLVDVPYPGFEGRPRAASRDAFLDAVSAFCQAQPERPGAAFATGIGALFALILRARGELDVPLIIQGPVLWGLEHRLFPRVMRWRPARDLLRKLLTYPSFQEHFVRKYFRKPVNATLRARFFEGYAQCSAFADLFQWLTADWLRTLEHMFPTRNRSLERITVWQGGQDRVVDERELAWTEAALQVQWPRVVFPEWGHYPMIDVPEEWADALRRALAAA